MDITAAAPHQAGPRPAASPKDGSGKGTVASNVIAYHLATCPRRSEETALFRT